MLKKIAAFICLEMSGAGGALAYAYGMAEDFFVAVPLGLLSAVCLYAGLVIFRDLKEKD